MEERLTAESIRSRMDAPFVALLRSTGNQPLFPLVAMMRTFFLERKGPVGLSGVTGGGEESYTGDDRELLGLEEGMGAGRG